MMDAKFNNALILSGGGTRLMIYLGIYAALEELQMKPEVIIGTCGGAIAATVINTFSDNESRKEYLKSEEFFQFLTKERLTQEKKLSKMGLFSLQKIADKRNAPFIEDVINKYIATIPQDLSEELPSLKNTEISQEVPTLIIGSEILFDPKNIGQKRNQEKLYKKVIFTDSKTAKRINIDEIVITSENYKNSSITEKSKIITNRSMLASARISISDMFYIKPVFSEEIYFAGGSVDLIPIELANHIATTVIVERKQAYTTVEEALVRAVLGYSGNKRMAEIQEHNPKYQIDTRNIKKDLDGFYIKKKIYKNKFQIKIEYPESYQRYRDDMEKQWEYGFLQAMKSINKVV